MYIGIVYAWVVCFYVSTCGCALSSTCLCIILTDKVYLSMYVCMEGFECLISFIVRVFMYVCMYVYMYICMQCLVSIKNVYNAHAVDK